MDTRREAVGEAFGRYVEGALERWDHVHARGFDDARGAAALRGKHYVIAGLVADVAGRAPRVLEVGCGFGTTYRLLRKIGPTYVGIDASSRAVRRCRARWGDDPACVFDVATFDRCEIDGPFDVIILDEALQGFSLSLARSYVEKAIALLSGPRATLVIAVSTPIHGRLFWSACRSALPAPEQSIEVEGGVLGRGVVRSFTDLVDHEAPPASGVASQLSRRPRPARCATAPNRTRPR